MDTIPATIHLKEDNTPHANHTPIPVPYHWKEEVKNDLDRDVERGIIKPVPIGTPVTWCSKMLVTPKKSGKPRRVVDFQKLNAQCSRETHHCPSPFRAASQVPAGTKKTVFDAVDGYHSVPLDESSQPLTTFITEWGRYQYCRMPQGYLAAGDAYTRRFDEILSNLPRKVKVVDDCLLYDDDIESSFYHAFDFLLLCAKNGVTINVEKFQFCQDTVEFVGLIINSTTGLGYLLLQKYCDCSTDNAPICCPDGWRLVFAGSRFTQNGEPDFAPTEGEALSLSWSLNHAKNFVLGCRDLIVVTDHKPLLGIFNDRD